MKARYGGRCIICNVTFGAGADIVRRSGTYAHASCVDREDRACYLLGELREIMLADYGASLGLDIDPRVKQTFDTPNEYLTFAHKADIIDDEQLAHLRVHFGVSLNRSMFD